MGRAASRAGCRRPERRAAAGAPGRRWTCSCARLLAHTTLHVVLAGTQACSTTFYSIWSLERAVRGAVAMACGVHGLGRHYAAEWGLLRASARLSPSTAKSSQRMMFVFIKFFSQPGYTTFRC